MSDQLEHPDAAARPSRAAPLIRTVGLDGLLVSFAERLSEPANRAALAFRAAVAGGGWTDILESSTSLVSTYLRFDPVTADRDDLIARLQMLLASRDWTAAELPAGRRLWYVPTCYDTEVAPQLAEAAQMAGLCVEQAVVQLSSTRVRVQTIGFAAGQPYLGELPEAWDIPRQAGLTERVPAGALTVAIRQLVLFAIPSPTGWRQVGQTALPLFRPDHDAPFLLSPGDEVLFPPVPLSDFRQIARDAPQGGATSEALA
ncbi:MAG: 5-oxoprolinase subunit B family protein [Hyphomonas sp.]